MRPLPDPDAPHDGGPGDETPGPLSPDPIRVLLVEDNPDHAALVEAHLADARAPAVLLEHATTAEAATAALARAREAGVPFHAVLADQQLPDSAHWETVARLVAAAGSAPVVALTSLDDADLAVDAVRAGASDYLVKSEFTPALVWRTLRYAVERARRDSALRASEAALQEALVHVRRMQARIAGQAQVGVFGRRPVPEIDRLRALADDLEEFGSVRTAEICRALADEVSGP